jgi:hypothetical protein
MKRVNLILLFMLISSGILKAQTNTTNSISTPAVQQTTQTLPKFVTVQIVNATIGPSKVDGSHWSGTGKVSPSVTNQLAQLLLGANPYTGIIGLLSGSLISGSGKPAPYGMVEVAINGQYDPEMQARLVSTRNELERTYIPIFHLPAYQNVPFDDGTRFKITLYSKNLMNPKPTPIAPRQDFGCKFLRAS